MCRAGASLSRINPATKDRVNIHFYNTSRSISQHGRQRHDHLHSRRLRVVRGPGQAAAAQSARALPGLVRRAFLPSGGHRFRSVAATVPAGSSEYAVSVRRRQSIDPWATQPLKDAGPQSSSPRQAYDTDCTEGIPCAIFALKYRPQAQGSRPSRCLAPCKVRLSLRLKHANPKGLAPADLTVETNDAHHPAQRRNLR